MPTPAPIFDPDRGWRTWLKSEIYTGPSGTGRYVPNIDDAVWDWVGGLYRVTAVNPTTGISTLVGYVSPNQSGVPTEDIFLGAGPGTISESFRVYVDKSVVPYTMAIDARLRIYSEDASYIKIFYGSDISITGQIISAYYDQSNILQGENIPLDSVTVPDISNAPIKMPRVGYTSYNLVDGDVVTAVAYSDTGDVICIARFIVKETAYIRQTDAGQKYIVGIHLESPFLSQSNNRLIEYPVNVTLASVPLMGVVTYSDGSTNRLPVDGNKFTLYGSDAYVSTILGQTIPLVLSYQLGVDEVNWITQSSANHQISENYEATTIDADGTYSVKLFVSAVWNTLLSRYRLEYYLYNLDRQEYFHVTPYIEIPEGAPAFDPTLIGTVQSLTVAIDLARVSGVFTEYRHVQTFKVALLNEGNVANFVDTRWQIIYTNGQNPVYGTGLVAKCEYSNVNNWGVDITCGSTSYENWLNRLYYASKPLLNPATETDEDIVPNYFKLRASSNPDSYIFPDATPVSSWDQIFTIDSNLLADGEVLYVDFIQRIGSTDLQMATAGLPFRAVYTP